MQAALSKLVTNARRAKAMERPACGDGVDHKFAGEGRVATRKTI